MYRLICGIAAIMAFVAGASSRAAQAQTPLIVTMSLSTDKAMGGETVNGTLRATSAPPQDRTFRLEASPTGLVKINGAPDIVLKAGQSSVGFSVNIVPSLVRTSVSIRAVQTGTTVATQPASSSIQIFPGLIRAVRISGPSMIGTRGASVTATVELNAPAPSSGIQVYPLTTYTLDSKPSINNPMSFGSASHVVAAGSRTVSIQIPYNEIRAGSQLVTSPDDVASGQVATAAQFNASIAHVALMVGIDPPTSTAAAQVTPGLSGRVTFDVVPLRVTSSSVQPAAIPAGNEALATATLSGAAGSSEVVEITPANSARVWVRLAGTSCQSPVQTTRKGGLQVPLAAGATTLNFKICTAAGATGSSTVTVVLRSGGFPVTVSVQP